MCCPNCSTPWVLTARDRHPLGQPKYPQSGMSSPDLAPTVGKEVSFRVIDADQTIALRHLVLWPNAPLSRVLLPEDNEGTHIGAFIPSVGIQEPIAVISLFQEIWPIDNDEKDIKGEPETTAPTPLTTLPALDNGNTTIRFRKFACEHSYQGGRGHWALAICMHDCEGETGRLSHLVRCASVNCCLVP